MTKYDFHKLRLTNPREYFSLRWQEYKAKYKRKPIDRTHYYKERYRKGLISSGISSTNASHARQYRGKECEFCSSTNHLVAHHRNRNQSDNRPENILTVCSTCHNRIHLGGIKKLISKNE